VTDGIVQKSSVPRSKQLLFSFVVTVASIIVSLAFAELFLRVKNSSMRSYDIEMWRYANELKTRSPDPTLDFEHVRSKAATLQSVEIRLNEWGLRGGPVGTATAGERRILFLGGSITLGWGVPEADTVTARLERMLGSAGIKATVLNGGVGNYNAERYVTRFFKDLIPLKPSDIVVHYFLRDAEELDRGGGNILLRHSELAVTLWIAYHRMFDRSGEHSLVEHYRQAYQPSAPGFRAMQASLERLSEHAKARGIRLYLAMTPDVHNLVDYKLGFVHDLMRQIAVRQGYAYVDLLPAMLGRPPQDVFAMPGDPHPNALGHELMAKAMFPVLRGTGEPAKD
jgi:lysophospholipase L1-like esterase